MKFSGLIYSPKPFYGSIEIRNARIHALTSEREPKRISKLILPGFISTHVHTVQTHARNKAENLELLDWLKKVIWPFEASLSHRTAYASAYDGMSECLRFGITTILDMATTRHTQAVFEAARDTGIRAVIGKALMDQGPKNLIDTHPLDEVFELHRLWHGAEKGRIHTSLCPRFALSCSEKLLRKVAEISDTHHLIHHTHASENKKECAWIQKHYGLSNIELLHKFKNLNSRTVIAHGVHLSSKDMRLLAQNKVSLSHCPTSNLKLASGIADIKSMKKINLSLGVDGAPCNNLLDPFFEMRLAHLLSRSLHGLKGLSAQKIFEMATMGGARALRRAHDLGSLEVHKLADLIVVQVPSSIRVNTQHPFESLIHSIQSKDILKVYVQGMPVNSRD